MPLLLLRPLLSSAHPFPCILLFVGIAAFAAKQKPAVGTLEEAYSFS